MSVLVIGAGELGTAMLEALVKHPARQGTPISVLLRPATINSQDATKRQSVNHLKRLGVLIEPGDVVQQSVSQLAGTFAKFDTVISCGGMELPKGTQLNLAKAALEAKVPRYFPWQFGVDYDIIGPEAGGGLFAEQVEIRKILRAQSKTNWIIISTGIFTSFLFVPSFGIVDFENGIVRALGSWDTEVTATSPTDIALMTAEVAFKPEGIATQVVFIAGDTISYCRFADLISARFKTQFKREEWNVSHLQKELENDPDNTMKKYQVVFGSGRGVSWGLSKTLNYQRDIKLVDVDKFIQEMPDPRQRT